MPPGRLGLRWVPLAPMRFAVSPPMSLFTGTGLSPRSWSPPLGAPVRCSPLFTCVTFSMNTMAFAHWVCSWLRVRGSSSPHLFLTCSGGGGGATSSLSLAPVSVAGCGACPSSCCAGAGVHPLFLLRFYFYNFCLFCFSRIRRNLSIHIARFSASESLRVYTNIYKNSPPFASSRGVP